MRKFPKLKYPSDPETDGVLAGEAVVTEKLDGANFRFTWDSDGELVVGTRNHTYKYDDPNLPTAFEHAVEYVQENADIEPWNYTVFGEAMHLHSLEYQDVEYHNPSSGSPHFGEGYPSVVIFDVWDDISESWMHWDSVKVAAKDLGIPHTREIARGGGQWLKENDALRIPEESMFGGQPEGVVVRRIDGSVRAKKVSEDFREQNAQAFNDPSQAASEAGQFVAAFVTDNRVEKTAHKLVDEGEYDHLHMSMMEDLPREVLKDVFEEVGWSELLNGDFEAEWDDDFKAEVRSKTSKKCARVLKVIMQEF